MKHTKGPWHTTFNPYSEVHTRVVSKSGTLIASIDSAPYNVDLIASAPELLEALKLVVDGLQLDVDEEVSGADVIEYLSVHWQTLKSAVKKAEGK